MTAFHVCLQTDAVNLINSNEDIESKLAISEKKLHSASQQAAELQVCLYVVAFLSVNV